MTNNSDNIDSRNENLTLYNVPLYGINFNNQLLEDCIVFLDDELTEFKIQDSVDNITIFDEPDFKIYYDNNDTCCGTYAIKVYNHCIISLITLTDVEPQLKMFIKNDNDDSDVFDVLSELLDLQEPSNQIIWYLIAYFDINATKYPNIILLKESHEASMKLMTINNGVFDFENDNIKIESTSRFMQIYYKYIDKRLKNNKIIV